MHERGNGIQIKRLIDFKRSLRYDWFTLYPSICMSVHKGNSCMSGICVDFRSLHIHRYVIATKYLWNNSLAKCIHLNECLMSFRWVVNLLLGSRLRSSTHPVCTYFAQRLWILKCRLLKSNLSYGSASVTLKFDQFSTLKNDPVRYLMTHPHFKNWPPLKTDQL